ncbi:unnamed protein product [Paramecium sonneborni]|uniref:Uncharacterized protein n=1 Tax=Paramecium sonneborni TaxID=65129 RepID=A0A8S1KB72_9CILI|nr:unnamed protein product [Paramecium sonneborni]
MFTQKIIQILIFYHKNNKKLLKLQLLMILIIRKVIIVIQQKMETLSYIDVMANLNYCQNIYLKHKLKFQKKFTLKEFGILYLISFVQENTQILRLRKQKFQIYFNDIKKQLPNNNVVIEFLQNPICFFEQMVNIDYSLIQSQSNFEKIKRLYEIKWFKRNNEIGEFDSKIIRLDVYIFQIILKVYQNQQFCIQICNIKQRTQRLILKIDLNQNEVYRIKIYIKMR